MWEVVRDTIRAWLQSRLASGSGIHQLLGSLVDPWSQLQPLPLHGAQNDL